jgi:hypothetical protein
MAKGHDPGAVRNGAESKRTEIRFIAEVERQLRASSVYNPSIRFGGSRETARIGFDTYPPAEHFRGSITASVIREICASSWRLEHVHDPLEYVPESGEVSGEDVIGSMMTIRLETEADR